MTDRTTQNQPPRGQEPEFNHLGDLTEAQRRAYRLISQPGGHGYGEFSGIRTATVRALERAGLVRTGYRRIGRRDIPLAWTPGDQFAEE